MEVKPGYKQTEVGVIPERWDVACLGDKTQKVGSGITPTGGQRVYKKEGRPFLRSQNIGWGYLLMEDIAFIDDVIHETFKATEIELEDVFLNITGASIGRSAVADARVVSGNVNQHVCLIRTNRKQIHPRFLNYFLLSSAGQRQIDSFQAGGNRQGLNFGQIRSFQLPIPPISEQTTIATVLSDTDALIESLDQLIAKKRNLKQAAIQQLLTGKRRLPGVQVKPGYKQTKVGVIPEDWEVKRLGDVGTFSKGKGIRKDEVVADGIPCIRYGEIYTHLNDHVKIFYSFIKRSTAKQSQRIKQGDLLFAGSGETAEEIGKCVAFLGDQEVYAGGDIVVFSPNGQNSMFLGYLMNHSTVANQKARIGQGDAVVHISAKNLAVLELQLPKFDEQTAIATILSDMDAEIAALESRRDKTRLLKHGMMQELLTGRIRLVNPEEIRA